MFFSWCVRKNKNPPTTVDKTKNKMIFARSGLVLEFFVIFFISLSAWRVEVEKSHRHNQPKTKVNKKSPRQKIINPRFNEQISGEHGNGNGHQGPYQPTGEIRIKKQKIR